MSHFRPDSGDTEIEFLIQGEGTDREESTCVSGVGAGNQQSCMATGNQDDDTHRQRGRGLVDSEDETIDYRSPSRQMRPPILRSRSNTPQRSESTPRNRPRMVHELNVVSPKQANGSEMFMQEVGHMMNNVVGLLGNLADKLVDKQAPRNEEACPSNDHLELPDRQGYVMNERSNKGRSRMESPEPREHVRHADCNRSNNVRREQGPNICRYFRRPYFVNRADQSGYGGYSAAPDGQDRYTPYLRTPLIKIPAFTGKEDFSTWINRFETLAKRYGWTTEDKLDNLLPRIEGQAADFVFSQLPPVLLSNYTELVQEMHSRYRVIETSRSFAVQFSRRCQRNGETVEEYAAELKRLYDKAHGYRDRYTREEDLVRRFLDGLLDDDIKFEVEFHKEPNTIDEAVLHVVNMLQIKNNDSDKRVRKGTRRTFELSSPGMRGVPTYRVSSDMSQEYTGLDYGDNQQGSSRMECEQLQKDHAVQRVQANREESMQDKQHGKDRVPKHNMHEDSKDEESNGGLLLQIMEAQKTILERIERLENQNTKLRAKGSTIECFNCHKLGHIARDCPNRLNTTKYRNNPENRGRHQARQQGSYVQPLNMEGPTLVTKGRSN